MGGKKKFRGRKERVIGSGIVVRWGGWCGGVCGSDEDYFLERSGFRGL